MTIKTSIILAFLASFVISAILGPVIIPVLRKIKAGQTEREEGLESHKFKTGTPTMGAFIFLISYVAVSLIFIKSYPDTLPIILLTLAFGVVGFIDDFIKVVLKRNEGLTPIQKALLQLVVSIGYVVWQYYKNGGFEFAVPFTDRFISVPAGLAIPIVVFIIVGTVNGSNFTDGVDGLETSVTAALCGFFIILGIAAGFSDSVLPSAVIMFGALLGFLLFNLNKARVFMGDTGALALGGFVSAMAIHYKLELYLPLIAVIYFVEVLSVILQVSYFKITHGKRIFRMAPIHHHFEKGGWSETKVVGVFTIVTIVICAISLIFIPLGI